MCGEIAEGLAPRPVREIALENGATLEVLDASRPLVGDRWQVAALFRLTVPVDRALADAGAQGPDPAAVRRLVGDTVRFEKRMERIFVPNEEKDSCFDELVRRYLDGNLGYLGRPAFARNCVLRHYREARRKAGWNATPNPGSAGG